MPIHVERVTSDVSLQPGELPLTEAQVHKLVELVLAELEKRRLNAERGRQATRVGRQVSQPLEAGD